MKEQQISLACCENNFYSLVITKAQASSKNRQKIVGETLRTQKAQKKR
jgi:hypothetical protein